MKGPIIYQGRQTRQEQHLSDTHRFSQPNSSGVLFTFSCETWFVSEGGFARKRGASGCVCGVTCQRSPPPQLLTSTGDDRRGQQKSSGRCTFRSRRSQTLTACENIWGKDFTEMKSFISVKLNLNWRYNYLYKTTIKHRKKNLASAAYFYSCEEWNCLSVSELVNKSNDAYTTIQQGRRDRCNMWQFKHPSFKVKQARHIFCLSAWERSNT